MTKIICKLPRPGAPGTIDYICRKYFDKTGHGDCPFKNCCTISNVHPSESATLTIVRGVSADTLEEMAAAIRAEKEEAT